jgi:hypothetical protein
MVRRATCVRSSWSPRPAGDDALDWQIGYQGQPDRGHDAARAVQFALVVAESASVGSDPDAHGIEGRQQPSSASTCRTVARRTSAHHGDRRLVGTGAPAPRPRTAPAPPWHGRPDRELDLRELAQPGHRLPRRPSTRTGHRADRQTRSTTPGGAAPGNATECPDVTTTGASSVAGPLTYPADAPVMCPRAGTLLDTRYMPAAAIAAPDDCHSFDSFFSAAPTSARSAPRSATGWARSRAAPPGTRSRSSAASAAGSASTATDPREEGARHETARPPDARCHRPTRPVGGMFGSGPALVG